MSDIMALTPDQATTLLHSMALPTLAAERPVTTAVISAIPVDSVDYRPDNIARTAIELAWHIVSAEHRFFDAVASGAFDLTPRPRPDVVRTPVDVVAWYDEQIPADIVRLKGMAGEQLIKPIDFRGLFEFPAVAYVQLALNHSIHHRGQLSMYLRPMGAKVPSIYGESFDAREARERAQAAR
jgi:uncharacterized damage-inducible protein DinB